MAGSGRHVCVEGGGEGGTGRVYACERQSEGEREREGERETETERDRNRDRDRELELESSFYHDLI